MPLGRRPVRNTRPVNPSRMGEDNRDALRASRSSFVRLPLSIRGTGSQGWRREPGHPRTDRHPHLQLERRRPDQSAIDVDNQRHDSSPVFTPVTPTFFQQARVLTKERHACYLRKVGRAPLRGAHWRLLG